MDKLLFTGPLGNDVFQCSPMPWVTYTHISHTNSGKKDNATPLFDWGKYYEKDGKNNDSGFCTGTSFICRWFAYRTICGGIAEFF